MAELTGKHALITGGSRGIGRAVTLALARAGAEVIACHQVASAEADDLAAELKKIDGNHRLVQADVTDESDLDRLIEDCRVHYGTIDVIVNNAGVISHVPVGQLGLGEWHRVIDTNLTATFLVIQKALPLIQGGASIVNMGSGSARAGVPLRGHYAAAKAGIEGLTRSLAKELGGRGIRLNVVAPGVVDSDQRDIPAARRAELTARYSAMTALGRLGEVDEIARVVVFLASDQASYITGETIHVDGGI